MSDGGDALAELSGAGNVLLLGPSVESDVDAACKRLLTPGDGDSVLAVSFMLSPTEWLRNWDEHVDDRPDETVVVTTSDSLVQPGEGDDFGPDVEVEYLSSAGDLTGLGMVISKYLERWHEREARMAVCFDSLTTLLQYEELHNVYRFLHLITTRLGRAEAHAHFHLDPATQSEKAVSTLSSTFTAIARYDDGWDVKRR